MTMKSIKVLEGCTCELTSLEIQINTRCFVGKQILDHGIIVANLFVKNDKVTGNNIYSKNLQKLLACRTVVGDAS